MSGNTRSSARDFARAGAIALIALAAGAVAASDARMAPSLPPNVAAALPQVKMVGGAEMSFLGLSIYEGFYWSPARGYSSSRPFALDLHYRRSLKGAALAERSVDEIAKLGYGTAEQRVRWGAAMKRIFPNVVEGDRITGLNVPGIGAQFFLNGAPIGEVEDPDFAPAFFGIWLDPGTSRPDFRKRLLGE